ncbi:MAG: tetratricopeptide repeat protein [Acidobacteria bacterium]|nr:tetratricopeptide repeat protein [Acidobacteriota bacterium]
MYRFSSALFTFALVAGTATAGTKEELIRLQSDILQLTTQIQLLQKSTIENDAILKTLLEQLSDRVAGLKVSMDTLNQTLSQTLTQTLQTSRADSKLVTDQMAQAVQSLSIKLDDTNGRIATLSQKLEESSKAQAQKLNALTEAGTNVPPDQLYNAAYNDYLLGNYDLAIQAFRDYLERFKDSEMADDAMYYIGVSYFDQKKYDQAIQAFDQLIQLYPKGNKVPTAYFKKGIALLATQKTTDAIAQLQYVYANFPDTPEANLAAQELRNMGVEPVAPPPARRKRSLRQEPENIFRKPEPSRVRWW